MVISLGYELKRVEGAKNMVKQAKPVFVERLGWAITLNTLKYPHSDGQLAMELDIPMSKLDDILIKHGGNTSDNLWIKEKIDCEKCCKYINENILSK